MNFSELILSSNCLWSFTLVSKDVPRFYDKVMDFLTIVVVRSTSEQSGKKPLQLLVTPNDLTTELWNNRELYGGHGGCNVVNIASRDPYRVSYLRVCKMNLFWEKEEKIFLIFLSTFFQENICTFWYLSWLSWKRNGKLWKITKFAKKWKKIEIFLFLIFQKKIV